MALTTPRIRVHRPDADPFTVQVLNPDLVRWDRERARQRWPAAEQAPMLWSTFVSWAAAQRTHQIPPDLKYTDWEATTEELEMVDANDNPISTDDEAPTADPTQPVPAPG